MRDTYNDKLLHPDNAAFRRDAERALGMFDETYKDDNHVVRWRSNDRVPPIELLDFWREKGKRFNYSATVRASKTEDRKFMMAYRNDPSRENIVEMRSVFGAGTTVVDVISGKKTRL